MENSSKQITASIDGRLLSVPEGITILEAARQNGIRIPTICNHPELSARGGCRLCLVEVDGNPKLAASCVMPVREGMSIVTSNNNIINARRTILEFLFAERNHYCMFCSQSGDCELQSLAYEMQMDHLTVEQSYKQYPIDITTEYMAIDHSRCVLCSRCVRACREIAGYNVLDYQNRGINTMISFDLNQNRCESSCLSCGACLQFCPTGAISNRYRTHRSVKGHDKTAQVAVDTFCTNCGLMCETRTTTWNSQQIVKIDGRTEPANQGRAQLCYKGRFEPLKTVGKRLLYPITRQADGSWKEASWKSVMDMVEHNMEISRDGSFGLISSRCANEQLMVFRDLMQRGWGVDYLDILDGRNLQNIAAAWKTLSKNFLAFKEADWKRILDADYILVAGVASFETQPLVEGLIRRVIMGKGSPAAVLGSKDVMSPWSRYYIPFSSGNAPQVIHTFLAQTLKSTYHLRSSGWEPVLSELKKIDVQSCLNQFGMDNAEKNEFKAAVEGFIASKNPIIIAGNEVTGLKESDSLHNLMLLSLSKGILPENALRLVILKPGSNSSGAIKLGIYSDESLAKHSETGTEKVLRKLKRGIVLLEDEKVEDSTVLSKLDNLDFLAVITPFFSEALKKKAHVLIPRPVGLEEEGTYTSLDGQEIRTAQALLLKPKDVSESWQTLLALMQRTDFHPGYARWKDISARAGKEIRA